MNYNTDQKISNLIEESILDQIKKMITTLGVLPKNILEKIKQKYRATSLEEAQTPAPKIEGITNNRDTCYTSVMKLIDKEKLIDKYDSLYDFIEAYHKKNSKIIKLHDVKIENLKPGTILYYKFKEEHTSTVNRGYGKFGMKQKEETSAGHLEIYLGVDPAPKNKANKYVTLGAEYTGDHQGIGGTGLELNLDYQSQAVMNKKTPGKYKEYIEVLDYNTIKIM